MTTPEIYIEIATHTDCPDKSLLRLWAENALSVIERDLQIELSIRIVDPAESQQLNRDFRGKNKPTNVLSFPFETPHPQPLSLKGRGEQALPTKINPTIEPTYLGDMAICAEIVKQEAHDQHKSYHDHFAHMVTHGILHLLGYDHVEDNDAEIMENLEIQLLAQLGIANPYQIQ